MLFEACFLHLIERLSSFHPMSSGLVLALKHSLRLVEYGRGQILVNVGKRQEMVWFLVNGTAREVTPSIDFKKGKVSWFWFEDDFVFSYPGFFAQEPAQASIELVEQCRMLQLSYVDLMLLRERFFDMQLLLERLRSYYERARVNHANDLANLPAKERYLKFYSSHKRIFNVARHKDIASFLGIRDDGFHRYQ